MTESYIISLYNREGEKTCVSMVESSEDIREEIARLALWLGERFQSATINHWQRVNSGGVHLGWYMRQEFQWRG